jgi:chemotaxis protein MotB
MKPTTYLAVVTASFALGGCVSEGKYDSALKDASDAKTALADQQKKLDAQAALLAKTEAELAACNGKPLPPDRSGELTAQLEELRKQKAAAEGRAALFNEFVAKFRKMIDAGRVTIHVRRGRIVLSLHNDVLFDEGKVDLKPAGKEALKEIGQTLRTVSSRSFQVAGHTDNLPIKSKEYPSNWELSTERAVVVVKFLAQQGVNAGVLSAAGYGEFDPVRARLRNKFEIRKAPRRERRGA